MTTAVADTGSSPTGTVHEAPKTLIVDDHALFRSGLRLLLETSLDATVHEAANGVDALRALGTIAFDIALLDIKMPDEDGISILGRIREDHPDTPVVMVSTFVDASTIRSALDGGASGFVLKEAEPQQLLEAITTAMTGRGVYVHPVATQVLLAEPSLDHGEHLTEREHEVLELLVDGATNDVIGKSLFLTEKTVKTHLSAIFRKLGVTNRTQAAIKALRGRLLEY